MKNKGSVLLIFLILFFLAVTAVSSYYFLVEKRKLNFAVSNTSSPTIAPTPVIKNSDKISDDGKYTNKKYGFSVIYPAGWSVYEFSTQDGAGFVPEGMKTDPVNVKISINVLNKATDDIQIPFEIFVKSAANGEIQSHESLDSLTKVTTDTGIVGYKTKWNLSKGGPSPYTFDYITYFEMPDKSKTSTIQVQTPEDKYIKEYDALISTFSYSK